MFSSIYSSALLRLVSSKPVRFQSNGNVPTPILTHIDIHGSAHQVDVSKKAPTERTAIAVGSIIVTPEILSQVENNLIKKGDVLAVANIASINASKKTSDLIPLCHNIPLSQCKTVFHIDKLKYSIEIESLVRTTSSTGVEMEALTAVSVAALAIYDMCKSVSHNMTITDIRVVRKTGGKSDKSLHH